MMASYLHYLATNRCTKGFESGHSTILLFRNISVKSQRFILYSSKYLFLPSFKATASLVTSLQSENRDLWRGQGVTPWGVRDPEDAPGAYGSDL